MTPEARTNLENHIASTDRSQQLGGLYKLVMLSLPEAKAILACIDTLEKRIAEQQAVIDQRNGECDRLINELASLTEGER